MGMYHPLVRFKKSGAGIFEIFIFWPKMGVDAREKWQFFEKNAFFWSKNSHFGSENQKFKNSCTTFFKPP